jgi:hypothetical protein
MRPRDRDVGEDEADVADDQRFDREASRIRRLDGENLAPTGATGA